MSERGSHLLQMRGLKHFQPRHVLTPKDVASFTDAWIETLFPGIFVPFEKSHLLQMRGLKQAKALIVTFGALVASFTDAWIETQFALNIQFVALVASFTDAWIETSRSVSNIGSIASHLLQMRGLKPYRFV